MKYGVVVADPPWNERGGGKIKRGADRHYPVMTKETILHTIAASDVFHLLPTAHLWLWAPSGRIEESLWLSNQLDFRFKRKFVWVKDRIGLGQYARGQHEDLLLCIRGEARVPTSENRPSDVLMANRRKHSQKPTEFYKLIETVSHRVEGPKLEMFAREARDGWDRWGLEAPEGAGLRL